MGLGLSGLRVRFFLMAFSFTLLAPTMIGECILAKALRVRQVCGQVAWPGTLRLTKRNKSGATNAYERLTKTDDEGRFAFKDIPAGEYELRVTPTGMREVFVPVLVDLHHPLRDDTCATQMDLKVDFLPEPCVSPELRKAPR
jgi:hypothetical protein